MKRSLPSKVPESVSSMASPAGRWVASWAECGRKKPKNQAISKPRSAPARNSPEPMRMRFAMRKRTPSGMNLSSVNVPRVSPALHPRNEHTYSQMPLCTSMSKPDFAGTSNEVPAA